MANPRQRRKTKSSTHKAVSHSRRAKKILRKMPAIRGPKALQDAWDNSKTVRQNYAALGLQLSLVPTQSGGTEQAPIHWNDSASTTPVHGTVGSIERDPLTASSIPKGFGRIVRDTSGNVISVDITGSEEVQNIVQQGDLPEPDVDAKVMKDWVGGLNKSPQNGANGLCARSTNPVAALERLSASARGIPRYSSCGERSYLTRLIQKYDDDYEGMAKDRRLNPEQKTVGELRRAVAKAGGKESLGLN